MRILAAIFCLYLFGLHIQPALFPLHIKKEQAMACCAKKEKKSCKGCTEGKGCDGNQCNPFFSQCPVCSANAVAIKKYLFVRDIVAFKIAPEFFTEDEHMISRYQADILHPPRAA